MTVTLKAGAAASVALSRTLGVLEGDALPVPLRKEWVLPLSLVDSNGTPLHSGLPKLLFFTLEAPGHLRFATDAEADKASGEVSIEHRVQPDPKTGECVMGKGAGKFFLIGKYDEGECISLKVAQILTPKASP